MSLKNSEKLRSSYYLFLEMFEFFTYVIGMVIILFVATLLVSHQGNVSNSRISMFSMVFVFYENGDDTFNAIENETEEAEE